MTDQSVSQVPANDGKQPWWKNKTFVQAALISVLIIAGAGYAFFYMWGPGAQERAAELRRNEQVRLLTTISEHCGAPVALEVGSREYPCVVFVRLDDGTIAQIRAVEIGEDGGGVRGITHPRARELTGELDVARLARRSYYERNTNAIAGPRDPESFAVLALEFQDQELLTPSLDAEPQAAATQ